MIFGLQVQLSETRRELQELKASLRVAQKEKEQLLAEKQVRNTLINRLQLESVQAENCWKKGKTNDLNVGIFNI